MVARLGIAHKHALVGLLFLFPLAFALWEIVNEQQTQIRFATQEIAGARYLKAVAPIQVAVERALVGGVTLPADSTASLAAIQSSAGATLASENEATLAIAALREAHDPAGLLIARSRLRDLIVRVGDRSNLILDNVLETYYLTDVVLNRLPDLLDRVADLPSLHVAGKPGGNADARVRFLLALGGLGATMDGLGDSMAAAEQNNADGTYTRQLHAEYKTLHDLVVDFSASLEDAAAPAADPAPLLAAGLRLNLDAADVLRQSLEARVGAQYQHRYHSLAMAAGLFLAAGLVMVWLSRRTLILPLQALTDTTTRLAEGDLEAPVPDPGSNDELGDLCRSVAVFKEALARNAAFEHEREQINAAARARLETMQALSRDFNLTVTGKLASVGESVGWLSSVPRQLTETAVRASARVGTAESAAQSASGGILAAAAAAEQLAGASQEISGYVEQTLSATRGAAEQAAQARGLVRELNELVVSTGEVVQLISNIARQSDSLARNAAAEAAQHGEAGRGIAAIAQGVEALAQEIGRATEDIARRIGAVRESADRAASMVYDVADLITQVEASAASIAAAINEQGAATGEMRRTVQKTTTTLIDLARAISLVRSDATELEATSEGLDTAADSLSSELDALREDVTEFVRANTPNTERRAHRRYEFEAPVTVATPTGIPMRGRTHDISLDGAAIWTGARFPPGAAVLLGELTEQPLSGRVIACQDGLVRIQFRHDEVTQRTIQDFVASHFGAHAKAA
jgi:methyl-accepting chemotaxis protein